MLLYLIGALFLCGHSNIKASPDYLIKEFNSEDARKAYDLVLDLRLEEAESYISRIKLQEPDNMLVHHIENLSEFLRLFINEDPAEFRKYAGNLKYRIDAISKSDASSPLHLYLQAEIELQWGIIQLKFGNYFKSYRLVKSAYNKLELNQKRFPNFVANKKSLGILHAVLGTIPSDYSWGVELISGMQGSISQGQKEIEAVLNYSEKNDFFFEKEAIAMYALLQVYINNEPQAALKILKNHNLDTKTQPISCFIYANIAMKQSRMTDAIKILENRPQGEEFLDFHYFDYMLGTAKLYMMDESAAIDLKEFVNNYPGSNYLKDAYQKLAWHGLIFKNKEVYQYHLDKVSSLGSALTDEDKAAQKEAESDRAQHPQLLKARLLFDGGNYNEAIGILNSINTAQLSSYFKQEYDYRLARTYDKLNKKNIAIQQYKDIVRTHSASKKYYACSAAYHLAYIYEQDYNYRDAYKAYDVCLSLNPDEYRASLHQKAKAGQKRISSEKEKEQ